MTVIGVNDGEQYGGGFYWAGGGAEARSGETSAGFAPLWTSYFGFQLICGASHLQERRREINVDQADLFVQETVGPALLSPDGLWQSSGWIRGDWSLHFGGDSPSGLCGMVAAINGQSVASSSSGTEPGGLASVQRAGGAADDPHIAVRQRREPADAGRLGRGRPYA